MQPPPRQASVCDSLCLKVQWNEGRNARPPGGRGQPLIPNRANGEFDRHVEEEGAAWRAIDDDAEDPKAAIGGS